MECYSTYMNVYMNAFVIYNIMCISVTVIGSLIRCFGVSNEKSQLLSKSCFQ